MSPTESVITPEILADIITAAEAAPAVLPEPHWGAVSGIWANRLSTRQIKSHRIPNPQSVRAA